MNTGFINLHQVMLLAKKVGLPRFELGSKRPKRPSIGQANPQTLPNHAQMFPFLNVTQEVGMCYHLV